VDAQAQAWPPSASTPSDTVHYLLTNDGDPDAVRDIISGSRTMRALRVGVELVVHLGGVIDVSSAHYQAKARVLAATWEKVVAVLQHPSNLRRTETYWYRAEDFDHPRPEVDGDRLSLKGHYTAISTSTSERPESTTVTPTEQCSTAPEAPSAPAAGPVR
jgi:hypothetical protein